MNIKEALTALDVADDEQWTADGLPKVDTMQEATANPELKRADITEAAPLFTRTNPVLEVEDVTAGEKSDVGTSPEEIAAAAELAAAGEGDGDKPEDEVDPDAEVGTGRDHPDVLAAQAEIEMLNEVKTEADKRLVIANKHLHKMLSMHAPLKRSSKDNQRGIMHHIQSQIAGRATRASNGAQLKDLLMQAAKSPLDQAAMPKLGHGTKRVVRDMTGAGKAAASAAGKAPGAT